MQYAESATPRRLFPIHPAHDASAPYAGGQVMRVAGKALTLRASVQNLSDEACWDAGFRDGLAVLGAPRAFLLSATAGF